MLARILGRNKDHDASSHASGTTESKPVVAKMGSENKMYYNKELKRWVLPGKEEAIKAENDALNVPPPPAIDMKNTADQLPPNDAPPLFPDSPSAAARPRNLMNRYPPPSFLKTKPPTAPPQPANNMLQRSLPLHFPPTQQQQQQQQQQPSPTSIQQAPTPHQMPLQQDSNYPPDDNQITEHSFNAPTSNFFNPDEQTHHPPALSQDDQHPPPAYNPNDEIDDCQSVTQPLQRRHSANIGPGYIPFPEQQQHDNNEPYQNMQASIPQPGPIPQHINRQSAAPPQHMPPPLSFPNQVPPPPLPPPPPMHSGIQMAPNVAPPPLTPAVAMHPVATPMVQPNDYASNNGGFDRTMAGEEGRQSFSEMNQGMNHHQEMVGEAPPYSKESSFEMENREAGSRIVMRTGRQIAPISSYSSVDMGALDGSLAGIDNSGVDRVESVGRMDSPPTRPPDESEVESQTQSSSNRPRLGSNMRSGTLPPVYPARRSSVDLSMDGHASLSEGVSTNQGLKLPSLQMKAVMGGARPPRGPLSPTVDAWNRKQTVSSNRSQQYNTSGGGGGGMLYPENKRSNSLQRQSYAQNMVSPPITPRREGFFTRTGGEFRLPKHPARTSQIISRLSGSIEPSSTRSLHHSRQNTRSSTGNNVSQIKIQAMARCRAMANSLQPEVNNPELLFGHGKDNLMRQVRSLLENLVNLAKSHHALVAWLPTEKLKDFVTVLAENDPDAKEDSEPIDFDDQMSLLREIAATAESLCRNDGMLFKELISSKTNILINDTESSIPRTGPLHDKLSLLCNKINALADDEDERFSQSFKDLWEELNKNDVSMIKDLQVDLQFLISLVKSKDAEITKLKSEDSTELVEQLRRELQSRDDHIAQLQADLARANAENKASQIKQNEIEVKYTEVNNALVEQEENWCKRMEDEKRAQEHDIEELKNALHSQLNELRMSYNAVEERLAQTSDELSQWQTECDRLSRELRHTSEELRERTTSRESETEIRMREVLSAQSALDSTLNSLLSTTQSLIASEDDGKHAALLELCNRISESMMEFFKASRSMIIEVEQLSEAYEAENEQLMAFLKLNTDLQSSSDIAVGLESLQAERRSIRLKEEQLERTQNELNEIQTALTNSQAQLSSSQTELINAQIEFEQERVKFEREKDILAQEKASLMQLNKARDEWMASEVDKLRNYALMLQKKADTYSAWQERARHAHRMLEQKLKQLDMKTGAHLSGQTKDEESSSSSSSSSCAAAATRDFIAMSPPTYELANCTVPDPDKAPKKEVCRSRLVAVGGLMVDDDSNDGHRSLLGGEVS